MRYSLSDLENRFAGRPNARWSSIRADLKSLETAEALREEMQVQQLQWLINRDEVETTQAAQRIANAVVADMPKPSYFDSLMMWVKNGV